MSLKMKLKMRDSELAKYKKKPPASAVAADAQSTTEQNAITDVDEIVRIETSAVREELQCEILRLVS